MAKIIYNGNGSDGGQAPVDSNTYAAGAAVYVAGNYTGTAPYQQKDGNGNPENIVTGSLSRTGAFFLYWNTAANGSGAIHGWPDDTSFNFPNQSGDLTLYAQWAVTTGLTNGGKTTHYAFAYDESLGGVGGLEPARTNSLVAAGPNGCEADFIWMQNQFPPGVDITKVISLPIQVYVTAIAGGGANATGEIRLKPGGGAASELRREIVAEVVEYLMHAQNKGWGFTAGANNEQSCGEALSMFLTQQFQILVLGNGPSSWGAAQNWLNSSLPASDAASMEDYQNYHYGSRSDYVNATLNWPGAGPATGCSLLFIYYLFHQLGFATTQIIANAPGVDSSGNPIGGSCLRGVYRGLTGDDSDPFPYFASLLAAAFPPSQVAAIAGSNQEDPWPIGTLSFVGAKNTWGKDEVNDIVGRGGTYADGLFLALDGFSLNILGGTQPQIPKIAFGGVTAQLSLSPPAITTQSSNPKVPQTILFAYDLKFAQPLGAFPNSGETPAEVDATVTVLGKAFPTTTEFFFLAGADPYFTNVAPNPHDPSQVNVAWLSQDLRVFTATPGAPPLSQQQYPVPGGPQFAENTAGGTFDIPGAYSFIQSLLVHLNQAYGDPSGVDPFDPLNNVIPQQQGEFTVADSSVAPFTTIGGANYNNYSFAVARVRMRGALGSAATGVKVFFRLWGTETADTGWDPTSTYLSNTDSSGNPLWPQAPADDHTIPFFATAAQPNFASAGDPEFKTSGFTGTGANNQTITILQGDSQWAYFGCFLNVNDATTQVNGVAIPNALPGTHHCLVAQIAYSGAPIQSVGNVIPTPETSDQLAQRNLQVTTSDNPGPPTTHRAPQTFDVRPSGPPPMTGPLAGRPDELMIDWVNTPPGTLAQIYWPAVSATQVVALASWMYGVHPLKAVDAWTIEMRTVRGVTFVPIPEGVGPGFAGLFTVDLPQTIVTGQEFNIVVRRISKRLRRPMRHSAAVAAARPQRRRSTGLMAAGAPAAAAAMPGVAVDRVAFERYIVGSFQVKIPVSTAERMLPAEETTLAILKARLDAMAKTNRWYPVLLRYIEDVSGRVNGLGGDAAAIPPSLGGYQPSRRPARETCEDVETFVGKVCEVAFDCFGDFSGFVLDDCCERRMFESRERTIGELALRALKERLTLGVLLSHAHPHRIASLVIKV